jgi:hypothetical protein
MMIVLIVMVGHLTHSGRGKSRYRGVKGGRHNWKAQISLDGRTCHVGTFDSEVEAAKAYDRCVRTGFPL